MNKFFWKHLAKQENQRNSFFKASFCCEGFTLIELLIVMVIIGTLVALALPKYQNALERGRALEGIRNAQYAAEYANAKHIACEAAGQSDCGYNFVLPNTDQVKSRFFEAPSITSEGVVTVSRKGTDWGYSITATISNDALSEITCVDPEGKTDVCESLDLAGNLMTRK